MPKTRSTCLSALFLAMGLGVLTPETRGQGFELGGHQILFDQIRNCFDHDQPPTVYENLRQNIYALDNLAEQMEWRYRWEVRRMPDCRPSNALYRQMETHEELTGDLVEAYRGSCAKTFRKAVCAVSDSMNAINELRRSAMLSDGISVLIRQSLPKADFIHRNMALHGPVARESDYDVAYFRLGQNVYDLDNLASQLITTFSNDYNGCQCRSSRSVMAELQRHSRNTGALVRAYRGTCPLAFSELADEVKDSAEELEDLEDRIALSPLVRDMIRQSVHIADTIEDNDDEFRAYDPYRSTGAVEHATAKPRY